MGRLLTLLGRGGGGAAWSPLSLPSLAAWYDAGDGPRVDAGAGFASASSQSLSVASNSTLQTGDADAWGACWAYAVSFPTAIVAAFGKWTATNQEWVIYRNNATNRYTLSARYADNSGQVNLTANTYGVPATGAWTFLLWYHDAANDLIGVSVNGGAFDTAAFAGGVRTATAPFRVGAYDTPTDFWNGRLDSVAFGKSPPGGIAAIATTIRDRLYNGGAGLSYADLTNQEKADWGLVSWYDFASSGAGLVADSHGSNTLTNNNGVTLGAGVAAGAASADGDAVSSWLDLSGNARHLLQSTYSRRPTYRPSGRNGRPVIDFDGVDDYLRTANAYLEQPLTVFLAAKLRTVGASGVNDVVIDGHDGATAALQSRDTPDTQLYAGAALSASPAVAAHDEWSVVTIKLNGESSLIREDGVQLATGNAGTGQPDGLTLASLGGTPGRYTQLSVAEVIACNADLSLADIQAAEAYLKARYATP